MALSENGQVIFHKEDTESRTHSEQCGVYVKEALSFADSHAIPVDGIAVSEGPGSYTGLRIGVSMAKGLCYGRGLPLTSVSTLKLLCVPVLLRHDDMEDNAMLVPMIDARRMEVYAAVYDRSLKEHRAVRPDVVAEDTYKDFLDNGPVYFFGNGSGKCKEVINHPNAHFIDGVLPLAKYMMPLAEKNFAEKDFRDVAYFEPFYLKDFVAIKPKKLF